MHRIIRTSPRVLAALFAVAVALPPAATAQAPQGDPMELVKQGRKLNAEGKQGEALALFLQAAKQAPELYDAHAAAGTTLDLMGRYAEARTHLARAIELAPEKSKIAALKTMAISYAFEGKAGDALRYEQQAFNAQLAIPDFTAAAETANELARIFLESGDINDAETWYRTGNETALRKSGLTGPERDLWGFRWEHAQARIAARRGKHEEAVQHVAAAKALLDKRTNPDQQRFFPYLAGYVAFYGGDAKGAIAQLKQADQRDPFILVLLAQAYEKTGDKASAMELYKQILTFNQHNPTNAFARPLARRKVG